MVDSSALSAQVLKAVSWLAADDSHSKQLRRWAAAGCIGSLVVWKLVKAYTAPSFEFKRVKTWPLIGAFFEIEGGKLFPQCMEKWAAEFHDEAAFEVNILGNRIVVVHHWEKVKRLLEMRPTKLSRNKLLRRVQGAADGVFIKEGAQWRRHRNLVAPALHPRNIPTYIPEAKAAVDAFVGLLQQSVGSKVNFSKRLPRLTATVLTNVLTGKDLGVVASEDAAPLVSQVPKFFRIVRHRARMPLSYWKVIDCFGNFLEGTRVFKEMRRMIEELIESAKDMSKVTLLTKLMEAHEGDMLTHDELIGNATTLFLAGTDTTASVLAWAFYEISRQPELQREMMEEAKKVTPDGARTMEQLEALSLTKAVWLESFRLHGSAPLLVNTTINDDVEIAGQRLPAGTDVACLTRYAARHSKDMSLLGEDLDLWRPKRWLDSDGTVKKLPSDTFAGFGHGARICVGRHLAEMEAMLTIAEVSRCVKLEPCTDEPREISQFTTIPDPDVEIEIGRW